MVLCRAGLHVGYTRVTIPFTKLLSEFIVHSLKIFVDQRIILRARDKSASSCECGDDYAAGITSVWVIKSSNGPTLSRKSEFVLSTRLKKARTLRIEKTRRNCPSGSFSCARGRSLKLSSVLVPHLPSIIPFDKSHFTSEGIPPN